MADRCVHAFIGKLKDGSIATYQTLPWNHRVWHAGGDANNTHIGFEICEDNLTDKTFYDKAFVGETIVHNFNWGNRNKEIVMYYISQIDLDDKIVNALNNALDSAYPLFKLRDCINSN